MRINCKLVNPKAVMPVYSTTGSGAVDLAVPYDVEGPLELRPGGTLSIDLGIAFEIPDGSVMLITGRSGMGFKFGVRLVNCLGVIDSDYRDTVQVKLIHDGDHFAHERNGKIVQINPGDRIAQAFILPLPRIEFNQVAELGATDRNGGFGSTGGFGN
jgi:dUTP pyrophosphatase